MRGARRVDAAMKEERSRADLWWWLFRVAILLRVGLVLVNYLAAIGGHGAVVAVSFVLFLVAEALRGIAMAHEEAEDADEAPALLIRRRAATAVRGVYLLWLAISVVALVLVAIGGFHDEDLLLLAAVWAILGLLLLLEYGLGPRGRSAAFTPRQTLALAVTGATVLLAGSVIAWQTTRPEQVSVFETRATSICEAFLPRVAAAPDLETALTIRREMRIRLSVLTPPRDREQRLHFRNFLASLEASEAADANGDPERARRLHVIAKRGATALGLEEACAIASPTT
jgi:hypothetical protein